MTDKAIANMYRNFANKDEKSAERWEVLAKDNLRRNNEDGRKLAIFCARQARHQRANAERWRKDAELFD